MEVDALLVYADGRTRSMKVVNGIPFLQIAERAAPIHLYTPGAPLQYSPLVYHRFARTTFGNPPVIYEELG